MRRTIGIFSLALAAAALCLSLAACGSSASSSSSSEASPETAVPEQTREKAPVALPLNDSTSALADGDYTLSRPVYQENQGMRSGDFCLSDYCSQATIDEGWWYYYTQDEGDIVNHLKWSRADGCYDAKITVMYTNQHDKPVDLSQRIDGSITFNKGGDNETVVDCTLFQLNARQKDEEGNPVVNTKVFDSVQPGERVQFGFFANIPRECVDSDKPLMLTFFVDGTAQYQIDLRTELKDNASAL